MTRELAPGSPSLTRDGPEETGPVSDSAWEGLDEPTEEDKTKASLTKIAKARSPRGGSAKG